MQDRGVLEEDGERKECYLQQGEMSLKAFVLLLTKQWLEKIEEQNIEEEKVEEEKMEDEKMKEDMMKAEQSPVQKSQLIYFCHHPVTHS